MLISIFITVFSVFAGVITLLCIFFQVKTPIKLSKRDMGFLILWIILMFLGITNLYYVFKYNDNNIEPSSQTVSTQETENQETSSIIETESSSMDIENADINLSEDELLIKQNFDLIQQLKAEYTEEDTKIINSDSVLLRFYEKACYAYQNLKETKNFRIIEGIAIVPNKIIILDYASDEIIYVFNPKGDTNIRYSPGDSNKFYGVIFHDDYEINVTPPISVTGGEYNQSVQNYLNMTIDEYTSLTQIRLLLYDADSGNTSAFSADDYTIRVKCQEVESAQNGTWYPMDISESGILSYNGRTYFSLNTDYKMVIGLYRETDDESELVAESVFDGPDTNSNFVTIYFAIDDANDVSD